MKINLIFCRNKAGLIEHVKIDFGAETKEDDEALDLLRRTGLVDVSAGHFCDAGTPPAIIYLPVNKEVFIH